MASKCMITNSCNPIFYFQIARNGINKSPSSYTILEIRHITGAGNKKSVIAKFPIGIGIGDALGLRKQA